MMKKLKSLLPYLMFFDNKTLFKLFGLFLILGFGAVNLTQGYTIDEHCICTLEPANGTCEEYPEYYKSCYYFDDGEYVSIQNNVNSVSREFQFNYRGDTFYKAFYLGGINGAYGDTKYYTLFWTNTNGLKVLYEGNNRVSLYSINSVCKYLGTDFSGAFLYCGYSECGSHQTTNVQTFINAVSNLKATSFSFQYNGPYQGQPIGNLCARYGNVIYCIRMGGTDERGGLCPYASLDQENLTNVGNGFEYYSSYFANSPFYSNPNNPNPEDSTIDLHPNTNQSVYDRYAEAGYTQGLCYSDFFSNDIATSTGGLDQFYGGGLDDGYGRSGSTIFDLYEVYSGGRSFIDRMDFWNVNYHSSVSWNNPINYVGKQKGLRYIFYKYNVYQNNISDLTYQSLYNYCSYYLGYRSTDNSSSQNYTGPDLPSSVSGLIPENELGQVFTPPEGSLLDCFLKGDCPLNSSGSSGGSGNSWVGSGRDSIFDNSYSEISKGMKRDDRGIVGILPRYIIVAFVASFIYYILTR